MSGLRSRRASSAVRGPLAGLLQRRRNASASTMYAAGLKIERQCSHSHRSSDPNSVSQFGTPSGAVGRVRAAHGWTAFRLAP